MEKISWSPKIRRLYQNDALGAVDEILVEDVGLGLLERCRSIWLVTRREVECPRCGTIFTLSEPGRGKCWSVRKSVQRLDVVGKPRRKSGMNRGNIDNMYITRRGKNE